MQILNMEQGSPGWLAARLGRVTMSELKTLLVNGKGPGGFGAGAFSYMHQLIGERITGELAEPFQGNVHTRRGHELEGLARELYRDATGEPEPQEVGIILNHNVGYSPDSLIGRNGLLEIKTSYLSSRSRCCSMGKYLRNTCLNARVGSGSVNGNGSTL